MWLAMPLQKGISMNTTRIEAYRAARTTEDACKVAYHAARDSFGLTSGESKSALAIWRAAEREANRCFVLTTLEDRAAMFRAGR